MKLFFSMDPVCRSIYLSERSGKARVVAPVGWNTGVKSEKRVAAKGGGRRSFCPLASHPTSFSLARCPVKSVTLWLPPVNEGTLSLSLSPAGIRSFSPVPHTLAFRLHTWSKKLDVTRGHVDVGCFIPTAYPPIFPPSPWASTSPTS